MSSYFITGTDTGIGKTIVTAWLAIQARRHAIDAAPMKPVQTGCVERNGELIAPDLMFTLNAAGIEASPEERQQMCPYRFKPACSPHLAAQKENVRIELKTIMRHLHQLQDRHDMILVEGAGGIFVPMDEQFTMLNLMQRMNLPVILVARAELGTINHSLLSIQALRFAGVDIAGIVFVQARPADDMDILDDNVATIAERGDVPVIGRLPYCPELADAPVDATPCSEHIIAALNRLPDAQLDPFAGAL
ncbi:MAG: dethiobiotin synthase [Spartobacteria bacterium]|nr:dethiobiotin synthase [Spartobacteria bacterium]